MMGFLYSINQKVKIEVNVSYIFLILKEKACKLLIYRLVSFSFVAEAGKISNLELFEDIFKILEIIESVNSVINEYSEYC